MAGAVRRARARRSRTVGCGACGRCGSARRAVGGRVLPAHPQLGPASRPRRLLPLLRACSESDVPFSMQAGTSGGLYPSECGARSPSTGLPSTSRETKFVLSHQGWPWCEEAIAMALKFPNVFLGTGAYPPRHWSEAVRTSSGSGPSQDAVRYQLPDCRSSPRPLPDRRARSERRSPAQPARGHSPFRVHRLPRAGHRRCSRWIGKVYAMPPQPPVEENTRWFDAGAVTIGVEYRALDPERWSKPTRTTPSTWPSSSTSSPEGGFTDEGVSLHVKSTANGHEYCPHGRVRG